MRTIDADYMMDLCEDCVGRLSEWEKESNLDFTIFRKAYDIVLNLLRTAPTVDTVTREEYNRMVEEYELLINNLKEEVPIAHVGCDEAVLGYEK